MNTKQKVGLWCGVLLIASLNAYAANPTGTVSVATLVELKDIGRNPQKAYIIVSFPSAQKGLMWLQLSKEFYESRSTAGGMRTHGEVFRPIFEQLFDTKIVIETDPGRFEVFVGQASTRRGYKSQRFSVRAGQQYIYSWVYRPERR